jgi:hypothetical protein
MSDLTRLTKYAELIDALDWLKKERDSEIRRHKAAGESCRTLGKHSRLAPSRIVAIVRDDGKGEQ